MNLQEQVPKDIARLALTHQAILVAQLKTCLLSSDSREWRNVNNIEVLRPSRNLRDRIPLVVGKFDVGLLFVGVAKRNSQIPITALWPFSVKSNRDKLWLTGFCSFLFALTVARIPVIPEQIHFAQRNRSEIVP